MSQSPDQFKNEPIEPKRLPHEIVAKLFSMPIAPKYPDSEKITFEQELADNISASESAASFGLLNQDKKEELRLLAARSQELNEELKRIQAGRHTPHSIAILKKGAELIQEWVDEESFDMSAAKGAIHEPGEYVNLEHVQEEDMRSDASAMFYACKKRCDDMEAVRQELDALINALGSSRGRE